MKKKTCSFLVFIHTLPKELVIASKNPTHYLYETAQIYQKLIDSDLLWKIWWIDEYNHHWVEINFMQDNQQPAFHTIVIDEGTFTKIPFEEYDVL